jgi:hypothetical protein
MTHIQVTGFAGENRALHPKALSNTVGVVSRNQKPGRGDLRPWRQPLTVASVPAARQSIYRMGRDVASDANYWLSWPGVVHAVRGFDAEDTTERTYFTGDGAPKVTDNIMALASAPYPTTSRPLGMPAPATAPTTMITGTAAVGAADANYFYTYTFVNDWGWESAPSPPSAAIVRKVGQGVTLGGFAAVPSGNYQINRIRVYRTQSGASGSADFFFLREIALATTTTTDDNRALGEVLPTTAWLTPPADLSHLSLLWNGMMAGISGNGVRICEAFTPYAWPMAYDIVPGDSKPVALGVFGQSLLVLTTGRPVVVAGSSPESMDPAPMEFSQGCISARSAVSMGAGVAWASEDGLCWYGAGGAKILTAGIMLREDWQALRPATIIGQMYEGLYFGSYDDGAGRKGFLIDPGSPGGIFFLDKGYEALHFDELQDQLYMRDAAQVHRWDAGATFMVAKFKSKVFRFPRPENFGAMEVVADAYPVTVKVFADGALKHTQTVTSRNPFRLPSGFSALDWQIEAESSLPVQLINMAGTMQEIADL